MSVSRIEDAIAAIGRGEMVVVVDDAARENEGDLIVAAEKVTPASVAFMVRHTSGVVCAALTPARLRRLQLPLMVAENAESQRTAFTVTVDCGHGTTTGISAADRAATLRALADAERGADDFVRPGHIFPLRAREGGVLERRGHTEAAVDLARLAGLSPVRRPLRGGQRRRDDGPRRASWPRSPQRHGLHRSASPTWSPTAAAPSRWSRAVAEARLPTRHGLFSARVYRDRRTGPSTSRWSMGEVRGPRDVLVRVHSECLTGDIFGSLRCDCGGQLDAALAQVASRRARRGRLPARPRGARRRADPEAARLQAAGAGARHRRGESGSRAAGGRPQLRRRRADPDRSRASRPCAS